MGNSQDVQAPYPACTDRLKEGSSSAPRPQSSSMSRLAAWPPRWDGEVGLVSSAAPRDDRVRDVIDAVAHQTSELAYWARTGRILSSRSWKGASPSLDKIGEQSGTALACRGDTLLKMLLFGGLVMFVAEIAAFVAVGEHIGFGWSVLLLLVVSALGPLVIRRVGIGVLRRTQHRLAEGQVPTRELLDGVVVLLGGVLICVPGFVTDAVGLLLMIGPIRRLVLQVTGRHIARRVQTLSPDRWKVINVTARAGGGERQNSTGQQEVLERGSR